MWICVCGETETRIWWREYAYLVMLGYGRDESAPTPGGLFVAHFTVCFVDISVCSPRIRNPFRMHSRNVRNVFVICVLHIRHAKVWFLACKKGVFTLQKYGFCFLNVGLLQFVWNVITIRSQRNGNPSAAFWQSVSSRRGPIYRARIYVFATHFVCVWLILKACNGSFAL